jgi:hypothetical protein
MVYSNRLYSAKATFQSNKEPDDAGFYTTNKTASTIFCNTPSKCYRNKAPYLYNFEQLYALKKAVNLRQNKCKPSFNSNDLNINLFTKLDLQNVCVVNSSSTKQCTSSINPSVLFFLNYTVDPSGVLFGNSECGISNYENYWVPNPSPVQSLHLP